MCTGSHPGVVQLSSMGAGKQREYVSSRATLKERLREALHQNKMENNPTKLDF
jgi:hypothetical protein